MPVVGMPPAGTDPSSDSPVSEQPVRMLSSGDADERTGTGASAPAQRITPTQQPATVRLILPVLPIGDTELFGLESAIRGEILRHRDRIVSKWDGYEMAAEQRSHGYAAYQQAGRTRRE